jgi:hypothetical protein
VSPPAFLFLRIPGGPAMPRLRRTVWLVRRSFSVGGCRRGRPRSISGATDVGRIEKKFSQNRIPHNRLTRKNIRRKFAPKILISFQKSCGFSFHSDCARVCAAPWWMFSRRWRPRMEERSNVQSVEGSGGRCARFAVIGNSARDDSHRGEKTGLVNWGDNWARRPGYGGSTD